MAVRGAPAIGIAAAWGVVLAARSGYDLPTAIRGLRASRPTAVNLGWALNRMQAALGAAPPQLILKHSLVRPLRFSRRIVC